MSFLEVTCLNTGYPNAFRLHDVSFSVEKGQFLGIIGPNGSGKSTLLKSISGELAVCPEQIKLGKLDLHTHTSNERARRIAVVSQFVDRVDIEVYDYVMMGRFPYRDNMQFFENPADDKVVSEYLALTGADKFLGKNFSQLSGGEQQLVNLAKALAQEPELLLLDEPTAHLDIMHQVQVLDLVQELCERKGITVAMVIHDLNLASEYCDQLLLMNGGRLHVQGSPAEVLNHINIEQVYNTTVVTKMNPYSNKPVVFLVSKKTLREAQQNAEQNTFA